MNIESWDPSYELELSNKNKHSFTKGRIIIVLPESEYGLLERSTKKLREKDLEWFTVTVKSLTEMFTNR